MAGITYTLGSMVLELQCCNLVTQYLRGSGSGSVALGKTACLQVLVVDSFSLIELLDHCDIVGSFKLGTPLGLHHDFSVVCMSQYVYDTVCVHACWRASRCAVCWFVTFKLFKLRVVAVRTGPPAALPAAAHVTALCLNTPPRAPTAHA